eukprot:gene13238-36417_t
MRVSGRGGNRAPAALRDNDDAAEAGEWCDELDTCGLSTEADLKF